MQALSQLSYTPLQNRNEILKGGAWLVNTFCQTIRKYFAFEGGSAGLQAPFLVLTSP
jgi:hypothetical protein